MAASAVSGTIEAWCADALAHHAAGRLAEAEQLYQRILVARPFDANALQMRGALALQRGEMDRAHTLLKESIRLQPNNAAAHSNLGVLLRRRGELTEAEQCFERALRLQPDLAEAHNNLGALMQKQGRFAEARHAFSEALRIQPQYQSAAKNLQSVQAALATSASPTEATRGRSTRPIASRAVDEKTVSVLLRFGREVSDTARALQAIRSLRSMLDGRGVGRYTDVLLALGGEADRSLNDEAIRLRDAGLVAGVIGGQTGGNPTSLLRVLIAMARAPYVLWLGVDRYLIEEDWATRVNSFIKAHHPFDVAGAMRTFTRDDVYEQFVRMRPWWKSTQWYGPEERARVNYPDSGVVLARVELLRELDYPDAAMTGSPADAVALGDLLLQSGGRVHELSPSVLTAVGTAGALTAEPPGSPCGPTRD
jgi:tetratricopeptide (TPR) repeat protein